MPTLQRLEVWTDLQCAGGTRQAVLPVDHCTRLVTTDRITHEDSGTLELSKDAASTSYITANAVVRFLFDDASFTEWRVAGLEDTSRASRLARVSLQSPLFDLAKTTSVISETVDNATRLAVEWKALTPAETLANILTFCPAWWTAGTVTPTIPVNLTTASWMPLRALRELVSAVRAEGVACELDFRRNGTTGYYIDLVTSIGSSASAPDVRTAKNLLGTTRTQDTQRYATEIIPVGSSVDGQPSTIARAYLEVTAKSGSTLTVQAPVTGGQVIAFDGQFDGLYLIDDANAKQLISSSGTDQQFDVASAANVTATRWYRLASNSSGAELVRVRKAPATSGPVRIVSSSALDDTTNLMTNPAMRVWTGASSVPPDGWVFGGAGTLARTTTAGLWLYGGKSCRLTGANPLLYSPTISVYVPSYVTSAVMSSWIYVTTAGSGAVRFVVDGVLATATNYTSLATGTWQRVDYTHDMTGLTGAVRSFYMYVGGVGQDSYYDSVQVTFTSSSRAFTEGSNSTRLLTLANQELTRFGSVPVSYQFQFADLQSWDPASFPHDTVTLGASANVRDTDLGITTAARIVEMTRDWRNLPSSALTLSSQPDDLISTLTGIADL